MKNQWQDKLRNRMEQHEESAPKGLWEDIEQALKAERISPTKYAQSKRILWYKRIGTAVAAAVLLFLAMNIFREDEKAISTAHLNTHEQSVPVATHPSREIQGTKVQQPLLSHNEKNKEKQSKKSLRKQHIISEKNLITEGKNVVKEEKETVVIQKKEKQSEEKEKQSEEAQHRFPHSNNNQDRDFRTGNDDAFSLPKRRRRTNPSQWQTGLYASNIPSNSVKEQAGGYRSFSQSSDEVSVASSDLPDDIVRLNEYQLVYSEIKHIQPITMGVSLKYNLDEKWSLTGGINYTKLVSELRSGSQENYYNSRQTLHYIGIPLNINYSVWETGKISTYVSAGGMVEKNVSGSLTTDYMINDKIDEQSTVPISVKPLQWSVNSAAGIEYKVSNLVGIYAEPGVNYYFKNKSEVETIYKEKPLNFTLRLGLSFSLNE